MLIKFGFHIIFLNIKAENFNEIIHCTRQVDHLVQEQKGFEHPFSLINYFIPQVLFLPRDTF